MSKVVWRIFFAWQLDKEKKFLEDMALDGYKLEKVKFGKYVFSQFKPRNIKYQLDFRLLSKKDEAEYLSFFHDWEYVCKFGSWYYFAIDVGEHSIDYTIFSNIRSQRNMYIRLLGFLGIAAFPLYYQLLLVFPNTNVSESTFPKFYGFFRIVVMILVVIHIIVCIKLFSVYKKLDKSIVE